MRSIVLGARSILVAVIVAGLVNLPAIAASEKPVGMVVAAEYAHLANTNAVAGADVYLDDDLVTDPGGSLRLKVGQNQVYLLSSSEATLKQQETKVRAKVYRGTVGFSTTTPDKLEIETPLGVVRGTDSQRVYGQVTIASSQKMVVTAYEGSLVVEGDGQSKTIAEGQSYSVSLASDAGGGSNVGVQGVGSQGVNKAHLLFALLVIGAAAGVAAGLYITQSDSCMTPPCN